MTSIKEQYLFLRLKRKNKDAFVEFYDRYFDTAYKFIYFKVGNKEEAEDLTSALFLKLWNTVREGEIKDHATFKAFMYTVARNIVIDHYRKKSQEQTRISQTQDIDPDNERSNDALIENIPATADEHLRIGEEIDKQIAIETVRSEIFNLKDEYREIIILRYMEEMSIDEIADILGKSKGNIRVLAHRALSALKELLKEKKTSP